MAAVEADRTAGADVRADGDRAPALRTNAPAAIVEAVPRQRRPRFRDTPWGRLRRTTGWSLRELSARTGVNVAELSRIERGIGPTPDQAVALGSAYGLLAPAFQSRLAAALRARSVRLVAQGLEREVLSEIVADRIARELLADVVIASRARP